MKYFNRLSIPEINKMLSQFGYKLIEDTEDKSKNNSCAWENLKDDEFAILRCMRIQLNDQDIMMLDLNRRLFAGLINFYSSDYSPFTTLIRVDDYSICEIMDQDWSISKKYQSFLINKFGKRYYDDLNKYIDELKKENNEKHNKENEMSI